MSDVERKQDNPSQDWQKADARVLGQILAAQNVVFTLPDTIRIAEFYAQILISIPGITACRVCLGDRSVQAGEMESSVCTECEILCSMVGKDNTIAPANSNLNCSLADQPDMGFIAIDSPEHRFGFFVFKIKDAAVFEVYHPFVRNLSNYVAITLENRLQQDLLHKAHAELERKVAERTCDLTAANEALAASRLAALNMMQEAVEARQRAEQANVDLQREVTEREGAEEALRESEELFRITLENILDPVFITDDQGALTFVCTNVAVALGYTVEEIMAMGNISTLFGKRLFAVDELKARGKIHNIDGVIVKKDGSRCDYLITVKCVSIRRGTILYSCHEITERKRAEEALRQAEEKYRGIFENAIEGIFQTTPEGCYLSVNPALARMHGYDSPRDLVASITDIGRQLYVIPEDWTRFEKALEEHGSVKEFVTEEYRKDGSRIWVSINARAVRGSDGRIRYYEGTVEDISEHRRLAEALKDSEARYRRITDTLTDYIYTVYLKNGNAVETRHGAGCLAVTGYSEEEFAADPHLWFRMVVEEDRRAVLEQARRVMAGEEAPAIEHRILRKDGMQRWVRNTPVVRRDAEGILLSYDGLMQDITERKRAEYAIRKLNFELERRVKERTAELEVANRELEAFAYSVSHDLRAPLRHIDGFLELLQKKTGTTLDEQGRHYMDAIADAARKMGLLIDDLLSFSRMGRQAMAFQPLDLGTLVRDVIRELEPDAAGRNIEWRIGELPAVGGDAAMLRMVLVNLISNALKFTRPRRQAQIEIGSIPGQDAEAVIFVRDNGVGFDMTYADKLFGVFQRLHRAEEFEGTGIGLANVRRIIARHGGRTWAEGKIDQSATFYFSLPHTPQGGGDEKP